MINRVFLLMAQFGAADIPLELVAEHYLDMSAKIASARANRGELPFPVFRAAGQKSPWLVSAQELASYLDRKEREAKTEWAKRQTG